MRIGFAGMGRMGARMALNCVAAGFDVSVWNRSPGPAKEMAKQDGVTVADTPSQLAEMSDIVLTMLANDEAAKDVYLGEDGLLSTQTGATIFVEMGTMSPTLVGDLDDAAQEQKKRFVDAPVSGATEAAQNAQLLIMAGARQQDFPELEQVFSILGRKTIWLDKVGNGAVMKLAVNMLIHGINQTLSEALSLAESAGIEPSTAYDVIDNSAAAAPMLKYRRHLYLNEKEHDVSFTVNLASKDVGLALAVAEQLGVAMPQTKTTGDILLEAINAEYGERDMASIYSFMKDKKT